MSRKLSFSLTIKVKLIFLLLMLLAVMAGINLYLRSQLSSSNEGINNQLSDVARLEEVSMASEYFEAQVYWLTEMSISLSEESEKKAADGEAGLKTILRK